MNYEERVLVLTGYKARAERAEAELERYKAALEFYAKTEHWMQLTEDSELSLVLVAQAGETGSGYAVAQRALKEQK